MNRTTKPTKNTVCFGHAAKPDARRLTDALTSWLLDAPVGALEQWRKGRAQRGLAVAEGCIARAVVRTFALPALLEGGNITPADDLFAREGARLLIAADLVAALLADHSKATRAKVQRCVGLLFNELRRADVPDFTIEIQPDSAEAYGLHALLEGSKMEDLAMLAAWYRRCQTAPAMAEDGVGFYHNTAIVREALFGEMAGRQFELPDEGVREEARDACLLAMNLAIAFRERRSGADSALWSTGE